MADGTRRPIEDIKVGDMVVALPQKYAGIAERAGVGIHDPSLLRGVDPGIHSRITTAWGRWERGLGRTPTADDITQFSYRTDEMYGSSFVW